MNRTRWVCLVAVLFVFGLIFFPGKVHATVQLSPSSLNFGSVAVNASSASMTITVSHTANATISVDAVSSNLPEFLITVGKLPVSVPGNASTTFHVTFRPSSAATFSGFVTVTFTGTNGKGTINLPVSGTGIQPSLSVIPASVSFGNVPVGVTNSQTMTIQNHGATTLTVTQATLSGSSYSLNGLALPLAIAPGASKTFNISFAPASVSSFPGTLHLVSNASASPTNIPLNGAGIAKVLKLSANPALLSFTSLTVGTSASQKVTLTNTGNSTVTISGIAASGAGFSESGALLPVSLAAGQSASFTVACAPASAGTLTGSVAITSNATNSPQAIALTATANLPNTPPIHSVNLTWIPSSSSYAGFNLYRSEVSGGPYAKLDPSLIASPSYTDSGVTSGHSYYYVATQVDSGTGVESHYSGEVSAVIP
jgi:hypothetical protein